ncbi:hypothetical protein [Pseudolysinimonas sp.]|uniref:hypothetical protein n=1 Tax=Pseudolysinimonas sp. TaxID=2680009 RepID=UPI00286B95F1|nr:hypothetical protein [Pseudolysinimonas sp.]
MTTPTTTPQPRNRVGIAALVLALFAAFAPVVTWIVVAIFGAIESSSVDDAIYVGLLGGMIFFFGVIALLSPISFAALVLGVISLFRPGSKAPGVVAIVFGAIGTLGAFGLPVVLSELVPDW